MEDSISRWHITQVEVDVEPHYTARCCERCLRITQAEKSSMAQRQKTVRVQRQNYRTKHSGQDVVESYICWVPEACVFDDLVSIKT